MNAAASLFIAFLLVKLIIGLAFFLWRFPWLRDLFSPGLAGMVPDRT